MGFLKQLISNIIQVPIHVDLTVPLSHVKWKKVFEKRTVWRQIFAISRSLYRYKLNSTARFCLTYNYMACLTHSILTEEVFFSNSIFKFYLQILMSIFQLFKDQSMIAM